jgi:hypothetical protein
MSKILPSTGVSILDAVLNIQAKPVSNPLHTLHIIAYIVHVLIFARRRGTAGLNHFLRRIVSRCSSIKSHSRAYPDHLSADLGDRLVLSQSDIRK